MTATRTLLILLVLQTVAPATAGAEWLITPFVGAKVAGETTFFDPEKAAGRKKLTLGGSGGWLGEGLFGVEGEFGHTPSFFEGERSRLVASSDVSTLTGHAMFAVPRRYTGESLRPFAVAGLGVMHVGLRDVAGIFRVNANLLAATFGGGAIGPVSPRASLRFELRYFRNLTGQGSSPVSLGSTRLTFWRASVGVAVKY